MSFKNEKIVETKTCRKCQVSFSITDKDLEFYERVSPTFDNVKYGIPTPTLCVDCREQRREAWRNERNLYKRKCDGTGKDIVSTFHADSPITVYAQDHWWSDKWSGFDYGRDFDFKRNFFEQFNELMLEVPIISILNDNNVASTNSEYSFDCWYAKNCYFVVCAWRIEDSMYCELALSDMKDCMDCTGTMARVDNCYSCVCCTDASHCFYMQNTHGSHHCTLGFNLKGCSFCYGCTNLVNKQYCIFNEQYSKEEYEKEIQNRDFQADQDRFNKLKKDIIYKALYQTNCSDAVGDNLIDSKDVTHVFDAVRMQDCKYYFCGDEGVNCMDILVAGECELAYENVTCDQGYNTRFSLYSCKDTDCLYSQYCFSCKDIFGCIGLKNQQYCIFNKQYSKDEYEALVPKIIQHMEKTGEWGEYFPVTMSPFGYNETMAVYNYPIKVGSSGFNWTSYQEPEPQVEKIIPASKLPENIKDIPDDILNWAIKCEVTGRPFRVIKPELEFYRKHNLPVPKKHPDQRYSERMAMRNINKLYERKCNKCDTQIQTTFSLDRPEKVYCENCYNNEVY
ncbi:hypothetical protein OAN96_01310 [Candidatus Gracilibacteria bacterium]|nr:hypothetical protein [Candidatus Gracilibacteria bacterium]